MIKVLAFGNPLLDTTITIKDDALLNKYGLKSDDQKEITQSQMQQLRTDILKFKQENTPGGCSQNTLRVLKWLLKERINATLCGTIGTDENGEILEGLLNRDGITTRYLKTADFPTGSTVALIKGADRALVAYLGAAEVLPLNKLKQLPDLAENIKTANIVYMEGFFLPQRLESARFIQNLCKNSGTPLVFNISAQYLCEQYSSDVKYFAENADILFGNKREYNTLAAGDFEVFISELLNNKPNKIVVVTDGASTVKMYTREGCFEMPVAKVEKIVDTTGAGDAFVGGFLAGFLCKTSESSDLFCCKVGCYAAQQIIQMTGCSLPKSPPLDILKLD